MGLAGQVPGLKAQFAGAVVKILRADEFEGVIAATNFGVDGAEVDVVGRTGGNDVSRRTGSAVRQDAIDEVVAVATTGQTVLTRPAVNAVDIVTSVNIILAGIAEEKILTPRASDRVVADAAGDDVLQVVAGDDVVALLAQRLTARGAKTELVIAFPAEGPFICQPGMDVGVRRQFAINAKEVQHEEAVRALVVVLRYSPTSM